MIHAETRHYKIIKEILKPYEKYDFYAFGSRVTGKHKPFSDLDLCAMHSLPLREKGDIEEAFRASRLPYTVDIVDWNRCSPEFQGLISGHLEKIVL